MSDIERYQVLLWIAAVAWLVGFTIGGPSMIRAMVSLRQDGERLGGALLEGLLALALLVVLEILILILRLQRMEAPAWANRITLYSIPINLLLMAVVFSVTSFRVQRK